MDLYAKDVLAEWKMENYIAVLCEKDSLETPLEYFSFNDARPWCDIAGSFDESCKIITNKNTISGDGNIKISTMTQRTMKNINIVLFKKSGGIRINIGWDDVKIFVGKFGYAFNSTLNLWGNSMVCIGDRATSNDIRVITANSEVIIGKDALISDQVILQSSDQHGIVDIREKKIINNFRRHIYIGRHVWLGRRCTIMPDVNIGDGSIVGAGAIVTQDIETCSIAVGVPARIVRKGASWSRDPGNIAQNELDFWEQPGG